MPTPDQISKQTIRKSLDIFRFVVSKKVLLDDKDFGLCPFHNEKTPSFSIYLGNDRARYHCFGCGATGDIFNYVQRISSLDFKEAYERIIQLLNSSGVIISPLLAEGRAHDPQNKSQETNIDPSYCFAKCQNYLDLGEDYQILQEENQNLRESLNLPEFQPSNEHTEPKLNFNSKVSFNKLKLG